MKTVLITAVYGNFDNPKPLNENHGFDEAVFVTDNPHLQVPGWRMIYQPVAGVAPRMAAKLPKMKPYDFIDADLFVWIDGSFEVTSNNLRGFAEAAVDEHDFAVWEHPDRVYRNCLYKEAALCQDWPKYRDYPIRAQVAAYRKEGMPEDFGLWGCGTIAWRNNDEAKKFGLLWLAENLKWSIQDQVSFPYLVWKYKPNFGVFDGHEYKNKHLKWHDHLTP